MPYKTDKLALQDPFLDKRTRLLPCQRERLLAMREEGLSYQSLADVFHISKRLAYFTVNPEKHERQKQLYALRQADGRYYDREEHNAAMRTHRQHKNTVLGD
jgi:hypothetical protein